jgi:hypothetical protein
MQRASSIAIYRSTGDTGCRVSTSLSTQSAAPRCQLSADTSGTGVCRRYTPRPPPNPAICSGSDPTRRRRSRTYQPMGYIGLPVFKTADDWVNHALCRLSAPSLAPPPRATTTRAWLHVRPRVRPRIGNRTVSHVLVGGLYGLVASKPLGAQTDYVAKKSRPGAVAESHGPLVEPV